jgi:LmbE family N-acetylglucosaminyl deacetylase
MRRNKHKFAFAVLLTLLLFAPVSHAFAQTLPPLTPVSPAQPPREMNGAEIQLALKKLLVTGSALYIAAHPDDENTAMLAYLVNGRLVRAGYLSLTRGDGGQNLIGSEKGALLGVIRTQELLAARRIDGAEQFFTRAIDFGYSKTPEETLRFWDKDKVLSDVVWIIRRYRPDVLITRFPTTGEGGHGHHTASAILAGEAFRAAGDPTQFPEQLKYVSVWQPKRIFWNVFSFGNAPPNTSAQNSTKKLLSIDLGAYNALLGKSYTEIAAISRSQHKSQGFGSAERRGTSVNYFQLLAGDDAQQDIFDGIDLSWRRIAGGERIASALEEANQNFDPQHPEKILPPLIRAYAAMNELAPRVVKENFELITKKRRELLDVIRACAGLWMEAVTADATVVPGEAARVAVTLVNRSGFPMQVKNVNLPFGAPAQDVNAELKTNEPFTTQLNVKIPDDAPLSQPYWLREEPKGNLFNVTDPQLIGMPENAPALSLTLNLVANGQTLAFDLPAIYRYVDRVRGEVYRPFVITPRLTVNLEHSVYVFPNSTPKRIRATIKNWSNGRRQGALDSQAPSIWRLEPAEDFHLDMRAKGDETAREFIATPPKDAKRNSTDNFRVFAATDEEYSNSLRRASVTIFCEQSFIQIDYPHIPTQLLFPKAEAKLVTLDLQRRGERIGYVMGAGDEVPESLRQVGYTVMLLSDRDLDEADLRQFDAIITGVRAYNTRARLRQNQKRLFDYVEQGGTLIEQYNTPEEIISKIPLGVYPFKLSNERVTDETAKVSFIQPDHPLLNYPNKITEEDFAGWVQERGLYFANEWDARYDAPIACHDPNETDKRGGLLYARYGKGAFIYTSYAFFRQLPAGVPGAYRLFVNMVSAGK